MGRNIENFFKRKKIEIRQIKYLVRENGRTVVCLFDGQNISTTIPEKDIMQYLPEDEFISIAKGVSVQKSQIVNISNSGVYTMTDGRTFQGRRRKLSEHKKNRKELSLNISEAGCKRNPPMGLLEKCALMDEMPLAFCVIELVFDKNGHGVDFVFRYCNKSMEEVEGKSIENMLNHSFYEVFANGDKKWLVAYADVALNGTKRIISDFSPEIDKTLTIYCYQPHPGYCACILIPNQQ